MELCQSSLSHIKEAVSKAVSKYSGSQGQTIVTDIHLQPRQDSGELLIFDDEDVKLADATISEWSAYTKDDFYNRTERTLTAVLNELKAQGAFDNLSLLKPFSFVLVDEDKETLSELLLIDDDTLLLNDELLKGLDAELDAFLKDLLEK